MQRIIIIKENQGATPKEFIIYFEATRLATESSTQRSKLNAGLARSHVTCDVTNVQVHKRCVSAAPQAGVLKQLFDSSEMATRFASAKPLFQWISFTYRLLNFFYLLRHAFFTFLLLRWFYFFRPLILNKF